LTCSDAPVSCRQRPLSVCQTSGILLCDVGVMLPPSASTSPEARLATLGYQRAVAIRPLAGWDQPLGSEKIVGTAAVRSAEGTCRTYTVTLSGLVNGQEKAFVFDGQAFRSQGGESFIARLWATRKIGYLLNEIRLRGYNQELVDEIVRLSTTYGVATPYTSFFVPEPRLAGQVRSGLGWHQREAGGRTTGGGTWRRR